MWKEYRHVPPNEGRNGTGFSPCSRKARHHACWKTPLSPGHNGVPTLREDPLFEDQKRPTKVVPTLARQGTVCGRSLGQSFPLFWGGRSQGEPSDIFWKQGESALQTFYVEGGQENAPIVSLDFCILNENLLLLRRTEWNRKYFPIPQGHFNVVTS